jgi:CheY-like chemotaxis protein
MPKILIIEDEPDLLKVFSDMLEQDKFEVIEAKDGKEGLQVAIDSKPDLILLDILMPVMDGIAVLKEIKINEALKNIPVIVLTNYSDNQKIAEAMEHGAYGYLIKINLKNDDLAKNIRSALSKNAHPKN